MVREFDFIRDILSKNGYYSFYINRLIFFIYPKGPSTRTGMPDDLARRRANFTGKRAKFSCPVLTTLTSSHLSVPVVPGKSWIYDAARGKLPTYHLRSGFPDWHILWQRPQIWHIFIKLGIRKFCLAYSLYLAYFLTFFTYLLTNFIIIGIFKARPWY